MIEASQHAYIRLSYHLKMFISIMPDDDGDLCKLILDFSVFCKSWYSANEVPRLVEDCALFKRVEIL